MKFALILILCAFSVHKLVAAWALWKEQRRLDRNWTNRRLANPIDKVRLF